MQVVFRGGRVGELFPEGDMYQRDDENCAVGAASLFWNMQRVTLG